MYKKKWVSLVLITFLMVFVLGPVNYASVDAIDDVVTEMQEIYKYMDECDKENIRAARTALQDFAADPNSDWDAVLGVDTVNNLLTEEVIAKFENEAAARVVAKDVLTDLGDIYYSTDATVLKNKLEDFKTNHTGAFQSLFGNDFDMADLYKLFADARSALPGVIPDVEAGKLANAPNAKLVEAMPGYLEKAMDAALHDNPVFSGKLDAIGWSTKKLIAQQEVLADFIDQGDKARLSLALALVRSETKLAAGSTTLQVDQSYVANDTFTINIMERNATTLVAWASGDPAIVEIEEDAQTEDFQINARAPGTTELIVYRDYAGADSDCDWLLKFEVTVVGAGVAVNGTITSWEEAGEPLVVLYDATIADADIRADMKDGNPENALENAAILGTSIDYDGVSKRYIQSFSFADVEAGTYKVAVYKTDKYVVKVSEEINVTDTDFDAGTLKLWLYGDVNDDGNIDSSDHQRIFEHLNGTGLLTGDALLAGNVNRDGIIIDSSDHQRLFEHLNGTLLI